MQQLSDDDLIELIQDCVTRNGETDKVEFKDARGGIPDELWKSITAFSNKHSGGGIIVFGIEESGSPRRFTIVNIQNIHELTERLTNYVNDRIVNVDRPQYRPLVIEGKGLLAMVLTTIQDEKKPCFERRLGMDRGACIRDGNTDRPITDDELRHFIRNSSAFKYDITAAESYTLENLSEEKIQRVLIEMGARTGRHMADSSVSPSLLKNLRVATTLENINSELVPTLAGVLVFARDDPMTVAPYNRYVIRVIRYAGSTPSSDIIDSQDISGTLDNQIDSALSFALRNIPRRAAIEGALRVERYGYPEEALREILANAVLHRDYSITESYTQIRIFDDRIEFTNPGNLPPGVTVDNIKEMQFSRNSVMASLMRDLNYLEEYGRGIDLVFSAMNSVGLPRPIFRNSANMFTVTLLGDRFSSLTERQLNVWQIILNRSRISARDVAEQLNVTRPTVISDINRLVTLGLVSSTGSGPRTLYEVGGS